MRVKEIQIAILLIQQQSQDLTIRYAFLLEQFYSQQLFNKKIVTYFCKHDSHLFCGYFKTLKNENLNNHQLRMISSIHMLGDKKNNFSHLAKYENVYAVLSSGKNYVNIIPVLKEVHTYTQLHRKMQGGRIYNPVLKLITSGDRLSNFLFLLPVSSQFKKKKNEKILLCKMKKIIKTRLKNTLQPPRSFQIADTKAETELKGHSL